MKPHDLRDSLVAMDLDKFDTDKFIALRNISPSPDDLPTLKGYEGDLHKLDEVQGHTHTHTEEWREGVEGGMLAQEASRARGVVLLPASPCFVLFSTSAWSKAASPP